MSRPRRVVRTGGQAAVAAAVALIVAHLIGWRDDPEMVAALQTLCTAAAAAVQHLAEAWWERRGDARPLP